VLVPLSLSREQRKLRAQIAANTRWSKEDPKQGIKPARAAYERRFELEVDPHGILPEGERKRRAANAMRAHMQRLALASSRARCKAAAS
jgi:hypothetical protein